MEIDRRPQAFVALGIAVAALGAGIAALAGGPYLSLSALSPWLVVFAIGLFTALFALPFTIHGRLAGSLEADARWERALLWWGAATLALLALAVLLGMPSGFDSGSWLGSLAAVVVVEAVLVLGTLVLWLLAN